ncbi:hypothetical protein BJ742DRAFT_856750 [Cladochytrium replicatum]|nr:hypothetical protein BJ742DRAFT_856750 [Cladochytrium replicatum]
MAENVTAPLSGGLAGVSPATEDPTEALPASLSRAALDADESSESSTSSSGSSSSEEDVDTEDKSSSTDSNITDESGSSVADSESDDDDGSEVTVEVEVSISDTSKDKGKQRVESAIDQATSSPGPSNYTDTGRIDNVTKNNGARKGAHESIKVFCGGRSTGHKHLALPNKTRQARVEKVRADEAISEFTRIRDCPTAGLGEQIQRSQGGRGKSSKTRDCPTVGQTQRLDEGAAISSLDGQGMIGDFWSLTPEIAQWSDVGMKEGV